MTQRTGLVTRQGCGQLTVGVGGRFAKLAVSQLLFPN